MYYAGKEPIGEVDALEGEPIEGVACGRVHTMAVSKSGEVWAWGAGTAGRLGTGCNMVSPP
eukprot:6392935-Pyramimonas_sp.AAC.3